MPKVSIIVPVYNVEKYISKCLDSLINQTLKDIEILIVNDGSKDNSQSIINEYKELYPNLIKTYMKKNGGLSDARNYALPYCQGEYIGFIDSDDFVDLNMYKKMYNSAKNYDSDIVICSYYCSYVDKNEIVTINNSYTKKELFLDMRAAAWNKIYRKSILDESRIKFPKGLIYEDTEFYCKLIPFINKVSYINEPLVFYVQRAGSIANTQGEKTSQIFTIFDNIIRFYQEKTLFTEYKEELEYVCARILLNSSFIRISKINEFNLRKKLTRKTIEEIAKHFPDWKKNKYIREKMNKQHLFMLTINKRLIFLYSVLFNLYYRLFGQKLV